MCVIVNWSRMFMCKCYNSSLTSSFSSFGPILASAKDATMAMKSRKFSFILRCYRWCGIEIFKFVREFSRKMIKNKWNGLSSLFIQSWEICDTHIYIYICIAIKKRCYWFFCWRFSGLSSMRFFCKISTPRLNDSEFKFTDFYFWNSFCSFCNACHFRTISYV